MEQTIIGLSGYAGVGKDAVAAILVDRSGFTRRALADSMREGLLALNPTINCTTVQGHRVGPWPLAEIVDKEGWDEAKRDHSEVRHLLQRFGTEAGRDIYGEDHWVNELFRRTAGVKRLVVPDVRFPNEVDAIRLRGGKVFRVTRPHIGPANDHISEHALDGVDLDGHIHNDGDLEELEYMVRLVGRGMPLAWID